MMRFVTYLLLFVTAVSGFVPLSQQPAVGKVGIMSNPSTTTATTSFQQLQYEQQMHYRLSVTKPQRRSLVRMQFLFGLGGPELVVILIAAAFLLGPEKLAELGKDAGKIAGELKEVPKEFQAGLAEGEAQARALKTKEVDAPATSTTTTVEATKTEEKSN